MVAFERKKRGTDFYDHLKESDRKSPWQHSIEETKKLAERIGIESPLIAKTTLDGASWFVLVLGLYDEVESAQAASRDLLKAYPFLNEPWVRPIESLKKSLEKFSG